MIFQICEALDASDYQIWLSDSKENWRLKLFPNYKGNRKQPKPTHYHYLYNLLCEEFGAEVAFGEEADDALGIHQIKSGNSVICSIDKDLKQIPGAHYDFVKREASVIHRFEGVFRFYKQLLVGDSGDNIRVSEGLSCKGIGEDKAVKMLEGCETEEDMFYTCWNAYLKGWKDLPIEEIQRRFLITGQLVKIRTKEGEIWQLPYPISQTPEQTESQ